MVLGFDLCRRFAGPPRARALPPLLLLLLVAVSGTLVAGAPFGCRRSAPASPTAGPTPTELQVLKEGRFLFTYVESNGAFSTTDKPEIIPEPARKMVRVIDPAETKNKEFTFVHTVDVNELLNAGKSTARPLPREAFETAAIAQLPPGASSPRAGHAAPPGGSGSPVDVGAGGPDGGAFASAPGKPVVTIYGTSWCGACRTARQYFSEKRIPFADKDVEKDPSAARELGEKAAKMGIPTDRVPVLEVRGRLLLGFDRTRVEALLGDPT